MTQLVLGTAGHIDHGKTALIRALTGVDTDRLPEEKDRGITIELGFAPLDLGSDLLLSVIDVPGHEGLVRTMVAGATGIDLVLLVVAADEGVMPQTREHLAICELLGIDRGVVALTKTDVADADVAELATLEVEETLQGTGLEGAAILPVSSVTGDGVDALREALRTLASGHEARTPREGPPRLSVDRAFSARGFGAVVTGTLVGSPLRVGDTVTLLPEGFEGRVRGLQSFSAAASEVEPGRRCAVNLQGVELSQISRGMVLTRPDALAPTQTLDVEVVWLPDAPETEAAAVEFLVGAAERVGRLLPIGSEALRPGRQLARLHVDGPPVVVLPGDRFVVRGFARTALGGSTLGGGRVLDPAPPHRRRSDPLLPEELTRLRDAAPRDRLEILIERSGFSGATLLALAQQSGLSGKQLGKELEALEAKESILRLGDAAIGRASAGRLETQLFLALEAYHRAEPLRPGMPRGALRGRLPDNCGQGLFERLLERITADGRVRAEAETVSLSDFVPILTQEQEALAARIRADAMIAALEPPTFAELEAELSLEGQALRDLLAHLERDGSLVRAPGDLWFDRGAVDELRARLVSHLEAEGAIDTSTYKDLIGTTRKYAVPLMELFDNEHLTRRQGEARVLRRASS